MTSLITLESDKSSVEVPSTHEGVIEKINVKVGDKVNKGDLILSLNAESATEEKKKAVSEQKKEEDRNKRNKNSETKRNYSCCAYITIR